MSRRTIAVSATLALLAVVALASGYYLYKHRVRVDEFGRTIALHPGNSKVTPGSDAKLEDAAVRAALPEFEDVPAAPVTELSPPASGEPVPGSQWLRSGGDAASTRYSSLAQITPQNVQQLQVAWTYHSNDRKSNIQCTPVIAGGVLYAPTAGNYVVAINGVTGSELWRFKPVGHPAQRGLTYWPGDREVKPRLFFTSGPFLYALDPQSGQPVVSFGEDGKVAAGGVVAPVIYENTIVVANWNVVLAFDLKTGVKRWEFQVLDTPLDKHAEVGADRGANVWGGLSMDTARGIVYVATGSPHPNFIGIDHPGDNRNANSVLALDARTGRKLWGFQEIRHDIWDLDIPAPPNLVTVVHEGKRVDAVAQVTKLGNTLLLDRVTGKPLFGYQLRRAPVSKLPGEQTSPYQPVIQRPQPFTRQSFADCDITTLSPEARSFVTNQVKNANFGWFEPFQPGKPTIYYNVHGGAQWTGAAFDPTSGLLYVSANEIPWAITVLRMRADAVNGAHEPSAGELVYRQHCAGCHGVDRRGKGMAPSLLGLDNRMIDDEAVHIVTKGRDAMPPIPVKTEDRQKLIAFLFNRDVPPDTTPARPDTRYTYFPNGYPKLLDDQGYPGTKPPWGTLNAIDLNTGKLAWKVPLGEYAELTKRGIPKTGTENFGGATVTAGGVVFCAGTRDLKIRAFDKKTGLELWSSTLPFGGFASPAVYEANGRQYVVIAATGGGKMGGTLGDAYVAFALPQQMVTSQK